ncbi:hypothetical protein CLOM_g15528 [Closterium sp. NIES-68]|nr:hypothetical protein CLOM_g15528 [Closterium sp. NIES-68]GJP59033.1 hypothetical protein CLOP_g7090 [Closterium sp. NIES-67]
MPSLEAPLSLLGSQQPSLAPLMSRGSHLSSNFLAGFRLGGAGSLQLKRATFPSTTRGARRAAVRAAVTDRVPSGGLDDAYNSDDGGYASGGAANGSYTRNGSTNRGVASSSSSTSASGGARTVPIDVALERIRGAKEEAAARARSASGTTSSVYYESDTNGSGASRGGTMEIVGGSLSGYPAVPTVGPTLAQLGAAAGEGGVRQLPSDETFRWSREDYNVLQRTVDVWSAVLTLRARLALVDAKWSYLGGFTEDKQRLRRRRLAAWVRETILQLGPTFIKLGQLFSTRSDLLPAEFVEELSKLQDRVPAFSADKARAMIEAELGRPLGELFQEFEGTPIAAASLGQVHRAVLHSGEVVVIKVQRPALKQLFDIDLENMRLVCEYFQNSENLGGPTRDWVGIYEECCTVLYQEIDYLNEGRNADRFRRDFRRYPWVLVPEVYWDYSTRKVLALSYLPGIKISDIQRLDDAGVNRPLVAQRAIEGYLIQILKTGFFHADPHPGNLAVVAGDRLVYYDFGMMGEIPAFTKDRLTSMFYAVYEKDAKKVMQSLVDLGALVPTGDLNSVRRSIQYFLNNLTGPKFERDATISAIGEDLFAIAVDQPFRFPATFTFVLRAFSTLEGVGAYLDPNFSFARIAAPYAQELLDLRDAQRGQDYVVQQLTKQASEVTDATVSMPIRVQRMDDLLQQIENGDLKLRVRVLEAERAARRAGIMQVATLNTVAAASLLNMGVSLTTAAIDGPATACFCFAGVFGVGALWGLKRIQRLDKFEKMI